MATLLSEFSLENLISDPRHWIGSLGSGINAFCTADGLRFSSMDSENCF